MSAVLNHLMKYEFNANEKRVGYADVQCNTCFVVRLMLVADDERMVDMSITGYNFRQACKMEHNSIPIVNNRLVYHIGENEIEKNPNYRWIEVERKKHFLVSMAKFDGVMHLFESYVIIDHLLDRDRKWMKLLRGFIYIIYFPKIGCYQFVVKGGFTDNLDGRTEDYDNKGRYVIVALFYVKFTSPAEKKLKSVLADYYGKPLSFKDKSKNLGKEYFQIKGFEGRSEADAYIEVANELIQKIAYEWWDRMPRNEILDRWYWTDYLNNNWVPKLVNEDIEKLNTLYEKSRNRFWFMEGDDRVICRRLCKSESMRMDLFDMYNKLYSVEFVKSCDPDAKASTSVRMPWHDYEV